MTLVEQRRVTPSPRVLLQELDGETVLLNTGTEHFYELDDVGTRIWQLLVEYGDSAAVVARMQQEYTADEAVIKQDTLALISELHDAGLVVFRKEECDVRACKPQEATDGRRSEDVSPPAAARSGQND